MHQPVLIAALILAFAARVAAAEGPRAHWERVTIDDAGSEVLTLSSVLPRDASGSESEEIPILSVLRDTLGDGDPDNDRLRYVWLLVDQRQGWLARWLTPEPDFGDMPRPLVDLSAPGKGVGRAVLRRIIQAALLDPGGAGIRIPSRSYLSGQRATRTVRLFEALTVMLRMQEDTQRGPLYPQEYSQVLARVLLAERTFGGLVRNTSLEHILEQELGARRQALGRNWELLRQQAEAEGLMFQPIGVDGESAVAATLWVSRSDLDRSQRPRFRSKFLRIADPWSDRGLRQWSGYTETWCFDSEGRRISDGDHAVSTCEEMIPLALYSLDHPKAPLLLIDFRSPWKPAFREAARRGLEEIPRTILGLTAYTHVQLRGVQFVWNSIRGRRGAPIRRPQRLRATAAVRQIISSSPQLEPEMREYLTTRLSAAAPSSSRRYESLHAWARSPNGLQQRIERDRGRELARLLHPTRTRWLNLVAIATAGLYRYRVPPSSERLALLDRERRLARAARVVEAAVAASPHVDVGTDLDRIREAAYELATVPSVNPSMQKRAERLLVRLVEQPFEDEIRREFMVLVGAPEEMGRQDAGAEAGGLD